MDTTRLSPELQEYISILIKRNVISPDGISDQMLINYLCTQIIDKDFL
ncbi:MAG: hypothetical protein N2489_05355 [Clostridia bacterium]|nr:hypothetical protein [Clostridia bacterium]